MKISLDGGAICTNKDLHFGNYTFTKNLLAGIEQYDRENNYTVYSFCAKPAWLKLNNNIKFKSLKQKALWLSTPVSLEEIYEKKDIFLAASYNISRTPMFAKIIKKGLNFLTKTMKKDILFLGTGGFAIAGLFYFLSPLILPIFLKAKFQPSITVLRLVIFALPFILISSVFLNALYVLKKAYLVFLVFVSQSIINVLLNLIFIPRYSYMASSYITVISEMVNTLLLILLFFRIKKNYHENNA